MFSWIIILPVAYLVIHIFYTINNVNSYLYKSFPSKLFGIAAFIKYFLLPILLWHDNNYYFEVLGPSPSNRSINLAIWITLYEMCLIYIGRYLYVVKSICRVKENGLIGSFPKQITKFYLLILIAGIIFTLIFPKLMFPDFYLFEDKNEIALKEKVPLFPIIIAIWKYLFFLASIAFIAKQFVKHNININAAILYSMFAFFICMMLTIGDSRWNVIFLTLSFFAILGSLYGKTAKKYMAMILPVFVILIFIITIYKFKDQIEILYEKNAIVAFTKLFANQLQSYFSGISLIAQSIDMSYDVAFNQDFNLQTLLNDFVGAIPIVSKFVDPSIRTNYIFNQYLLGGNTTWFTQIIPSSGIGYLYFGFWLSPIFTVTFNILGLHLEKLSYINNNIFIKYILIMSSFWFSLSLCFNTQIPFGNVVVYQLPIFIVYYFFKRFKF